jgi:cytoskeleton protein RodZ
MTSVGETLRRERLKRNLDLDQISRELKISSRFLEAIEAERFDKLPAGVFAKSFVRQYARLLHLDEEGLAAQVQRAIEPEVLPIKPVENWQPPSQQEIHVPRVEEWEAVSEGGRFRWPASLPALALVVVVMLVCSGVYSFWQRTRHPVTARATPPAPTETVPPPQEQPQPAPAAQPPSAQPPAAQPPTKEQPPAAKPPEMAAVKPPEAPASATPQVPTSGTDHRDSNSADRPAPEGQPGATPPKPAEPVPNSNPNATVRVELTADEPVWVLARADGKYLFSGTLEPKQTRVVEASGTLLLRLGNAGGVNISLNGKPIGTLGAKGQVRDVQFTSGGFQIVAAPKPSLPLVDEPI